MGLRVSRQAGRDGPATYPPPPPEPGRETVVTARRVDERYDQLRWLGEPRVREGAREPGTVPGVSRVRLGAACQRRTFGRTQPGYCSCGSGTQSCTLYSWTGGR